MTLLKFLLGGAVAIAGAAALPSQSKASEWGCQVLLCLSGDWQGTPSCHPPIYKLIAAMKEPGFRWPTRAHVQDADRVLQIAALGR